MNWAVAIGGGIIGYALCMCTVVLTMLWDGRVRRKRVRHWK